MNNKLDQSYFFDDEFEPDFGYALLYETEEKVIPAVTLDSSDEVLRIFNEDKSFDMIIHDPKSWFNPDGVINIEGYIRASDDENSDAYYMYQGESLFLKPMPKD